MAKTSSTHSRLPQIKPAQLRRFHTALRDWYRAHGRHDLPWRRTTDPYAIWISEVMLQQTQVATVCARFYQPFLQQFPNVAALAAATQDAVLKAWEGLGYYSRARHLHRAAHIVCEQKLPVFGQDAPPTSGHHAPVTDALRLQTLLSLPGIGRNTAHAILAFGYARPFAVLEANVKRVVARIFALPSARDADLWQGADLLLQRDAPFDYNQAMMDLGALLCTPRAPDCGHCPARGLCAGKVDPQSYPAKKTKKRTPLREVMILIVQDRRGRLRLVRNSTALLGGLWAFPQQPPGSPPQGAVRLGSVRHAYTHFALSATVYLKRAPRAAGDGWFSRREIAQLALSRLEHKVLALLDAAAIGLDRGPDAL